MTRVMHPQHNQRFGAAAPTSSYFSALRCMYICEAFYFVHGHVNLFYSTIKDIQAPHTRNQTYTLLTTVLGR
jgi:hypothetical protein